MSRREKILLAMITVGQGHRTAAEALRAHLEQAYPGRFDLEVLDFTAAVGDVALDRGHKASWDAMLAQPWSAYWGQRLVDTVVPVWLSRAVTGAILADHARHAAPFLAARAPDLVVATHFYTVRALAIARARHGLDVPVVGLNPDPLDSHALWTEPNVDEMIVFSERAAQDLAKRGVSHARISRFPYLMRPEFPSACDASGARRALGLDPDAFTVVHSAGGQGIGGNVERSVDAVLDRGLDLQYVVICGRNDALRRRMEERARDRAGPTRLHATGFVTDMPLWICAADVVVGKAGPASTFEALISGRPVLHTSYAAANEKAVLDWCLARGVGGWVPDASSLAERIAGLATSAARRTELRMRVASLGIENGGQAVARHLVATWLDGRPGARA